MHTIYTYFRETGNHARIQRNRVEDFPRPPASAYTVRVLEALMVVGYFAGVFALALGVDHFMYRFERRRKRKL